MSTSHPTTSTVTDQMTDALTRGQSMLTELATGVGELWSAALSGADDAARRSGAGSVPALPSATEIVDRAYDTGIAVLELQRSAAHQVIGSFAALRRP
ncbi:hypothetical protein WCD74_21320 [Actinomycetospora sp. OC33-EN08]|uniref:Uncharacterized protein n=1 Tax=Actinomycetospora aurantiaca TaxID=3129233 RepID=A0ABU8MSN1_9PSEU